MRLIPASRARSKTRRASSSEDVTPFKLVCDAPNVIAPSESALTRNPEVPSLRNSTDRSPEVSCRRIRYKHNRPTLSNTTSGGRTDFRWVAATFRRWRYGVEKKLVRHADRPLAHRA